MTEAKWLEALPALALLLVLAVVLAIARALAR
jgi:hypothetical protein